MANPDMPDIRINKIYKVRKWTGNKKQPKWKAAIKNLHSIITKHNLRSSYNISSSKIRNNLMEVDDFANGGNGRLASMEKEEYLYHFRPIGSFKRGVSGWKNIINPEESDKLLFNRFTERYNQRIFASRAVKAASPWLQLSIFSDGEYTDYRGFTWWSDFDCSEGSIVSNLHKIGLPNNWIGKYSIAMRVRRENFYKLKIRIPSTIDGYHSQIFHPTWDKDISDCGKTINLSTKNNLEMAMKEFVLKPIDVNLIEFKPVLITDSMRKENPIELNDLLYKLLHKYYKKIRYLTFFNRVKEND